MLQKLADHTLDAKALADDLLQIDATPSTARSSPVSTMVAMAAGWLIESPAEVPSRGCPSARRDRLH